MQLNTIATLFAGTVLLMFLIACWALDGRPLQSPAEALHKAAGYGERRATEALVEKPGQIDRPVAVERALERKAEPVIGAMPASVGSK